MRTAHATDHAVERFIERVRPELYPSSAQRLLERQVAEGGEVLRDLPEGWPSRLRCGPRKGYVKLPGDDVVAVVRTVAGHRSRLVILSVLVRPRNREMARAFDRAEHEAA